MLQFSNTFLASWHNRSEGVLRAYKIRATLHCTTRFRKVTQMYGVTPLLNRNRGHKGNVFRLCLMAATEKPGLKNVQSNVPTIDSKLHTNITEKHMVK